MNTELKHDIYIDWELAGTNPYKPLLTRVITAALAAESVTMPCEMDVLLTDGRGHPGDQPGAAEHRPGHGRAVLPHVGADPRHAPGRHRRGRAGPGDGAVPPGRHGHLRGPGQGPGRRSSATASSGSWPIWPSTPSCTCWAMTTWTKAPMKAQMRAREEAILEGIGVTRDHFDESLNAPLAPACLRPAGGEALRHDHPLRPPQRGQIHPDQRPGGGEGRHRHQQAPDHPQPHLRRADPGREPVRLCGHPRPAQGRATAWGTTWSMWSGAAWPTWTPCCCWWSRSPTWAGRKKSSSRRSRSCTSPPCWSSTRSTRWKRTSCWPSSRLTARSMHFTAVLPISARTGERGWTSCWTCWPPASCRRAPSSSPEDVVTDQPERQICGGDRAGEAAVLPGQGDPPRHGGGGHQVLRAGRAASSTCTRPSTARRPPTRASSSASRASMLKKISTMARAGRGALHGHQGVSGDLGQGQGELAGQPEPHPQLWLRRAGLRPHGKEA